ncbi:MAG: hypothetical protein QXU88_01585 [Candidatus Woesearchaeota archaeon]
MPARKKKSIFEGSLQKEGIETGKSHSHEALLDEPEEHEESPEELEIEMHVGERQPDVYTEEGREELIEGEEISEFEEAFAEGASGRGHSGVCEHCGKPLGQRGEVVEREIEGELYFFCSESCAAKHAKRHATK